MYKYIYKCNDFSNLFCFFSFFKSYIVETRPTLGYLSGNIPTQLSVCNLSGTYF